MKYFINVKKYSRCPRKESMLLYTLSLDILESHFAKLLDNNRNKIINYIISDCLFFPSAEALGL